MQRLARDVEIGLPARKIVKTRRDDLLIDQRDEEDHNETNKADQSQHSEEFAAVCSKHLAPANARPHGAQNIDQPSDEPEKRRLDRRRHAAEDEHRDEGPFRLANVEPDEAGRRTRRLYIAAPAERIDPVFKQTEYRAQEHHCVIVRDNPAAKATEGGHNLIFW